MCKVIRATGGEAIIVDDSDYDWLAAFQWSAVRPAGKRSTSVYAQGRVQDNSMVYMHRMIMKPESPEIYIDHINSCGLDNRRSNLRISDAKLNANNVRGRKSKPGHSPTTIYRGVSFGRDGKFKSYAQIKGRYLWIGSFDTAEEAAKARDRVVLGLLGEAAKLNFPISTYGDIIPATKGDIKRERRILEETPTRSRYVGVVKRYNNRGFAARIMSAGQLYGLGTFKTEKEAALAYDSAALYFGQDRNTINFPDEPAEPHSPEELRVKWPVRGTTGYLGVFKSRHRFESKIQREGKLHRLGYFPTAEEAAKAYDTKAIELGDTLNLNFPRGMATAK